MKQLLKIYLKQVVCQMMSIYVSYIHTILTLNKANNNFNWFAFVNKHTNPKLVPICAFMLASLVRLKNWTA